MIGRLVRTKLESNLISFIVFIALIAAATIRYLMTRELPQGPVTRQMFLAAAAPLTICCFVPGIISLLRQNRERSSRLYAQLPVSPRQIRVAYWLHASLYLVITAVMLEIFVALAGTGPAAENYYLLSLALIISLYVWLAGLSLATSNLSRVLSERIRRNTLLYGFIVTVATFLLVYALILISLAVTGQLGNEGNIPKLLATMTTVGVAMITLDIYLFGKKDHNVD